MAILPSRKRPVMPNCICGQAATIRVRTHRIEGRPDTPEITFGVCGDCFYGIEGWDKQVSQGLATAEIVAGEVP